MYVYNLKMKRKNRDDMDIGAVDKNNMCGICGDEIGDPFDTF